MNAKPGTLEGILEALACYRAAREAVSITVNALHPLTKTHSASADR